MTNYGHEDFFNKSKFPVLYNPNETLWGALVQPAIHYTMGGIEIDQHAQVIGTNNLYAAGEVTGGIHGANRLAGNSLLETVVFGRIAGKNASKN